MKIDDPRSIPQSLARSKVNALIRSLQEAGVEPGVLNIQREKLEGRLAIDLPLTISTTDKSLYFSIDHGGAAYSIEFFPGHPKGSYLLAPEAARDLTGIWRYIKKQSSLEMADRVEAVIRDRIVFLAENPNARHWRKDLTSEA